MFAIGFAFALYLLNPEQFGATIRRFTPQAAAAPELAGPESTTIAGPTALAPVPLEAGSREPDCVKQLNYLRTTVKLKDFIEDTALSKGDFNHARYMVKNEVPLNGAQ